MKWNWQLPNWPQFRYDSLEITSLEKKFLQAAGGEIAILKHLEEAEKKQFIIEILCTEGMKSSEIEGEILERESLQSSIQRHLGLITQKKAHPKEKGMADLLWSTHTTFDQKLTHKMLYTWHKSLMHYESKISEIGKYRTHDDPMQIIAGRYDRRVIYFEAPPSKSIHKEMEEFIKWFNNSAQTEPALIRAAIAHVYFESIHPFEDGNGRIGRALVEKTLSQNLGYPILIAISQVITKKKKEYYKALASCNQTLDIHEWVRFFAEIIIESQEEALSLINFLMAKSKLMSRFKNEINHRQEKVLLKIFAAGTKGFDGGLSAENYISITKTSRATATRDLVDLVKKGVLYKSGQLKYARYWLNIKI